MAIFFSILLYLLPLLVAADLLSSSSSLLQARTSTNTGSSAECEIAVRDAADLSVDEFRDTYENEEPVLIRGGSRDWTAQRLWTKHFLLSRLGTVNFWTKRRPSGPTEVESLNDTSDPLAMLKFADVFNAAPPPSCPTASCDDTQFQQPPYIFHGLRWVNDSDANPVANLMNEAVHVPVYFRHWVDQRFQNRQLLNYLDVYFSAGRNNSGLGRHSHAQSWLGIVTGQKKWCVQRPDPSGSSDQDDASLEFEFRQTCLICQQRKGDLLYLPADWAHAVVNVGDVVAIAAQPL